MQLDSTRIVIRERKLVDILDLSLHVIRSYLKPLLLMSCCCIVPLMLFNHALLGWLLDKVAFTGGESADASRVVRFLWNMTLLIFIEAPLVSIFATVFLGRAVFNDPPKLSQVVKDVLRLLPHLLWTYGFVRGVGLAIVFLLAVPTRGSYSGFEAMLIIVALWAFIVRAMRPFINEIILLERAPLSSKRGGTSLAKRSSMLHGPSGSDIFVRWLGSAFFGALLYFGIFGTFIFLSGVLLNDWRLGPVMIKIGAPLAMWMVAMYFTVVRYLCYLDLRIRHEGWEVELRLRAEGVRMASKLA